MAFAGILSDADISAAIKSAEVKESFNYKTFFAKSGLRSKARTEVRKVFEILDIDKSGFIEESDAKLLMKKFSNNARKLTDSETKNLMSAGDSDGDGKIGLDEFLALVEASSDTPNI
ncbi:parvalbumin beta-like [Phyllobates terribilis]|uniref:parvalbumin beta-like n=1 Tax=Phyllobates terribilis TaxID=111132 RepID=UPI003CCACD1C